ncbi:hypothetical protein [Inquilinus sp.]|uniref:hypothetical protein n=1 Tax=Inquilinus sp. TaxID=1932117 RepID=UPI0031E3D275
MSYQTIDTPPPPATRVLFYGDALAGGKDHEIGFRIESTREWWERISPTVMELRTETTSTWSVQTIRPTHWRYLDAPDV